MAKYVSIPAFKGDWNNNRHGRRVQCPRCGRGFKAFIPIIGARCRCGATMKVLTADARTVASMRKQGDTPAPCPPQIATQAALETLRAPDPLQHHCLTPALPETEPTP